MEDGGPRAYGGITNIGDPENKPQFVGFFYSRDPKKVPLISETPIYVHVESPRPHKLKAKN